MRQACLPQTASEWVSDIRTRFYASRDALIYRLSLLGWTQQEIGDLSEITQQTVSKITTSFAKTKTIVKSDFYEKNKSIEEICEYYQIDEPLAWAWTEYSTWNKVDVLVS